MKMDMIASKPFRYGTRALTTNDRFSVSRRDARLLEALGRARRFVPKKDDRRSLEDLRAEAEALGIEVDGRWGEKRLLEEIAKVVGE